MTDCHRSPEIAPARGDTRKATRSAICSGLDSPPLPISTSEVGAATTAPGLMVFTVTPDPATLSARFLAAMIRAALRTEPATLPVTKGVLTAHADDPSVAGPGHDRQSCVGHAKE